MPADRPAMERGLGADDDVGLGNLCRRGVDLDDALAGNERGQLVTHAAHTRAQDAQLGRAALGTYRRSLGGRVPSEQLVARGAHQQTEAPAPVQHADRQAGRVVQRVGECRAEQSGAGGFLAPVDDLDARPPAALDVRRRDLDLLARGKDGLDSWRR